MLIECDTFLCACTSGTCTNSRCILMMKTFFHSKIKMFDFSLSCLRSNLCNQILATLFLFSVAIRAWIRPRKSIWYNVREWSLKFCTDNKVQKSVLCFICSSEFHFGYNWLAYFFEGTFFFPLLLLQAEVNKRKKLMQEKDGKICLFW